MNHNSFAKTVTKIKAYLSGCIKKTGCPCKLSFLYIAFLALTSDLMCVQCVSNLRVGADKILSYDHSNDGH